MKQGQLSSTSKMEGRQQTAGETRGQAEVYLRVKGIKPPTYRF